MKLGDYTREQLLALLPGEELERPVDSIMGYKVFWSRDVTYVGVMLVKLREYWPGYAQGPFGENFVIVNAPTNAYIETKELPHVCALALCLAAWDKEKNQ